MNSQNGLLIFFWETHSEKQSWKSSRISTKKVPHILFIANVLVFLVVNRDRYQRWLRRPWRLHCCSSWWFCGLAQYSARQWIHVHVQLWVAFGRISRIFFGKGCSDPAVDSRPAQSWFCWSRYTLCCVFFFDYRLVDAALVVDIGSGVCSLVLLVLLHVALCGLWGSLMSCSMEKCTQLMLRLRGLPELIALGIWTFFLPLYTWCRFWTFLGRRGSGGGGVAEARRAVCRAGYCSAHDLFGPGPFPFCLSPSAERRTVGGSADGATIRTCGHCHESPGAEGSSGTG